MSFQTPDGPPSAKRRRLEAASATLRKPFRSPLISRQQNQPGSGSNTPNSASGNANRNSAVTTAAGTPATPVPTRGRLGPTFSHWSATVGAGNPVAGSPLASPSLRVAAAGMKGKALVTDQPPLKLGSSPRSSLAKPSAPGSGSSTLTTRHASTTPRATTDKHPADEDTLDLLQSIRTSQTSLSSHLLTTRQRLELVRQARHIELASEAKRPGEEVDVELKELVGKWKGASRAAAEELFGLIKGRVEGMGGGRAWRESRRWQREGGGWDDFEEGRKREGDGDGEEGENEDGGGREWDEGGGDEDGEEEEGEEGFTMLMMLKSLNIDPEVLGYDSVEEKWKD